MGISESELQKLAEMGKKVPHMDMVQARWWFAARGGLERPGEVLVSMG